MMYIDNPNFPRRRIVNSNKNQQYSPKKRWDQGSYGMERNSMIAHVQNTLRQHQRDGQILQKFRKQAQQYKLKKRKQKFPHLYQNPFQKLNTAQEPIQNRINFSPHLQKFQTLNHDQQFHNNNNQQNYNLQNTSQRLRQLPKALTFSPNPIIAAPQNNFFQLQARLQYERLLAQKDMQIFKKEQKIKHQKKQIKKLYNRIKTFQRDDQLQKYVKAQQQMKNIDKMLDGVKQQLQNKKINSKQSVNLKSLPSIEQRRRNKSQLFLNSHNKITPVINDQNENGEQQQVQNYAIINNPSVLYHPQIQKNKSSVFKNVPLYNPPNNKGNLNDYLQQLKGYSKRIQNANRINRNYNKLI